MSQSATFELGVETAEAYVARARYSYRAKHRCASRRLAGGVSSSMEIADSRQRRRPRAETGAAEAPSRRRLAGEDRTDRHRGSASLCTVLTHPVRSARSSGPRHHVLVMELAPGDRLNWQAEIARLRPHLEAAGWAGETLGAWHRDTADERSVADRFDDHEAFAQLGSTRSTPRWPSAGPARRPRSPVPGGAPATSGAASCTATTPRRTCSSGRAAAG